MQKSPLPRPAEVCYAGLRKSNARSSRPNFSTPLKPMVLGTTCRCQADSTNLGKGLERPPASLSGARHTFLSLILSSSTMSLSSLRVKPICSRCPKRRFSRYSATMYNAEDEPVFTVHLQDGLYTLKACSVAALSATVADKLSVL
jgi:hypothetical protein